MMMVMMQCVTSCIHILSQIYKVHLISLYNLGKIQIKFKDYPMDYGKHQNHIFTLDPAQFL